MRVLIAGRPGSSKGTQARRVSAALCVPHVSTGDLLREAIRLGTPLGQRASDCVAGGRLVPDALVIELVFARLERPDVRDRGFLLDGFPRTLDQLDALTAWLVPEGLDAAVELVVTAEVAQQRLVTRARDDDTLPLIRERLDAFERHTTPMLRRLESEGLRVSIAADCSIRAVAGALLDSLRAYDRPARVMELVTTVP
jgi:adenylate kinase